MALAPEQHNAKHTGIRAGPGSKLRTGVEQSLFGSGLVRTAATARPGVSRVGRLDAALAGTQGPVAEQTGQGSGERGQTTPAGEPPVRATAAGVVGTRGASVRVRTVVVEGLDAAQARRVVDDSVRGAQALVIAHPARGQGPRTPARFAPAPAALRADDVAAVGARLVRPHQPPHGVAAQRRWKLLGERHRLLGDRHLVVPLEVVRADGHQRQARWPLEPVHGRRRPGLVRLGAMAGGEGILQMVVVGGDDGRSERGLDVLIVGALGVGPRRL